MFKRFFTFGSVVVFIFLIFVFFFFESISKWGVFAQFFRASVIVYAILHLSFIFYNIYWDKKDQEKSSLSDIIIKKAIEKRKKRNLTERFG
jgi:amino acid permease